MFIHMFICVIFIILYSYVFFLQRFFPVRLLFHLNNEFIESRVSLILCSQILEAGRNDARLSASDFRKCIVILFVVLSACF